MRKEACSELPTPCLKWNILSEDAAPHRMHLRSPLAANLPYNSGRKQALFSRVSAAASNYSTEPEEKWRAMRSSSPFSERPHPSSSDGKAPDARSGERRPSDSYCAPR